MCSETGQAHTSTPKPSQPRGRRLDNFDRRKSNELVARWQSLAKTGMQEAAQQILDVEMRRTISITVRGSQPVASQVLQMHFLQLLVRLVLPDARQRSQVQKINLLMAAPIQDLTLEVLNQMQGTWRLSRDQLNKY